MILKASQRRGGKDLALHLMNGSNNEHVTIHEIKGYISQDIVGAFQEAKAYSLATNCSQYLFAISINPPEEENVNIDDFEDAIDKIEKKLGLTGQPRVIVFHEKNGRRHCHCAWSRIYHDGKKFKAINMAHFKYKLKAIAKGDRRGYVAVDFMGEVYSLTRWLGVKTKELKAKIGDHKLLPSAEQAKEFAESRMTSAIRQYLAEKRARAKEQRAPLVQELRELVEHQREQRKNLLKQQRKRWIAESKQRASRFKSGTSGIWDLVTGKDAEIRDQNEEETERLQKRDRDEMHRMVQKHLKESRDLHKTLKFYKQQQREDEWRFKRQIAAYLNTASEPEHAIEVQVAITEKLAKLESRITAMSGDIAAMQDALDDAMISDDMKAKIRSLIERAKETFLLKRIKTEQIKHKKQQTEAHLLEMQQRLFRAIEQHEALKQQQAEQQRIIAVNTAFHTRVMSMQYSLNGVPMHKIIIADPPLDMNEYRKTLSYQSSASLVKTIKTKPPKKQVVNAANLAKSTATVSEILRRAKVKPSVPSKAGRHKTSKPKPNFS